MRKRRIYSKEDLIKSLFITVLPRALETYKQYLILKQEKMKTTVIPKQKEPLRKYPYFGIGKHGGSIVFFTEKNCGVVIHQGFRPFSWPAGHVSKNWNEDVFDLFKGTITIED